MAITDIQISEELETNAPSIKYRGNEGPKSPQEMQQKAEYDMQEYIIEFENIYLDQPFASVLAFFVQFLVEI